VITWRWDATPPRGLMVHLERFRLLAQWAIGMKHSLPGRWVGVAADERQPDVA
jgi:hypothetical protein